MFQGTKLETWLAGATSSLIVVPFRLSNWSDQIGLDIAEIAVDIADVEFEKACIDVDVWCIIYIYIYICIYDYIYIYTHRYRCVDIDVRCKSGEFQPVQALEERGEGRGGRLTFLKISGFIVVSIYIYI